MLSVKQFIKYMSHSGGNTFDIAQFEEAASQKFLKNIFDFFAGGGG